MTEFSAGTTAAGELGVKKSASIRISDAGGEELELRAPALALDDLRDCVVMSSLPRGRVSRLHDPDGNGVGQGFHGFSFGCRTGVL